MSTAVSSLIVRLIDNVSGPARRAGMALQQLQAQAARGGIVGGVAAAQVKQMQAMQAHAMHMQGLRSSFFDAATGAYALFIALRAPIKAAVDLDRTYTSIRQKLNMPVEAVGQIKDLVTATAKEARLGLGEVADAFDQAVGKGLNPLEDPAALKVAAKLKRAYKDVDLNDAIKMNRAMTVNLGVQAQQMELASDMLAAQGKSGSFEIADSARDFAASASQLAVRGHKGLGAVNSLGAAFQAATFTSATPAEASNNILNLLTKIDSPETRKKYKKLGVDIRKELKAGAAKGEDIFETFNRATLKATKGDLSKIGDIFQDMQAQSAARALTLFFDKYKEFKKIGAESQGTLGKDFLEAIKGLSGAWDDAGKSLSRFNTAIGNALSGNTEGITRKIIAISDALTDFVNANPAAVGNAITLASGLIALRIAAIGAAFGFGLMKGGALMLSGWALAAVKPFAVLAGAIGAAGVALRRFAATVALGFMIGGWRTGLGILASSALAALNPIRLLGGALAFLASPVVAVTAIAAALGGLVYLNWEGIKAGLESFGTAFMNALGPEARGAVESIGNFFSRIGSSVGDMISKLTLSKETLSSWGTTVGGALGGAVEGIIGIIRRIGDAFDYVIGKANAAAAAIKSALTGHKGATVGMPGVGASEGLPDGSRAGGGPVTGGASYLVGERGPEMFTPARSGRITPNNQLGRGGGGAFNPSVSINVTGNADPRDIARHVRMALEDLSRDLMRGVHSDFGAKVV